MYKRASTAFKRYAENKLKLEIEALSEKGLSEVLSGGCVDDEPSKALFQLLDAFYSGKIEDGKYVGCDDGEDYEVTDEDIMKVLEKCEGMKDGVELGSEDSCGDGIDLEEKYTYNILMKAWG